MEFLMCSSNYHHIGPAVVMDCFSFAIWDRGSPLNIKGIAFWPFLYGQPQVPCLSPGSFRSSALPQDHINPFSRSVHYRHWKQKLSLLNTFSSRPSGMTQWQSFVRYQLEVSLSTAESSKKVRFTCDFISQHRSLCQTETLRKHFSIPPSFPHHPPPHCSDLKQLSEIPQLNFLFSHWNRSDFCNSIGIFQDSGIWKFSIPSCNFIL